VQCFADILEKRDFDWGPKWLNGGGGVIGAAGFWPSSYIVKKDPVICLQTLQTVLYIASLVYNIFMHYTSICLFH
jgi:hypothetical protein